MERAPVVGQVVRVASKALFPSNVRFGATSLPACRSLDASADAVYSSHVLERLGKDDVARALANTFRIPRPGGVFRMIVPDLEWRTKRYLAARQTGDEATIRKRRSNAR